MKNIWFKCLASCAAIAMTLSLTACDDDEDKKEIVINTQDQWIGAPCGCVGSSEYPCDIFNIIPLPSGSPISGCDNMPEVPGARNVCMRTIEEQYKNTAPWTYFPQGYCALSAVSCEGASTCDQAAYGDIDAFKSCPEGSALVEGAFSYQIMGEDADFRSKVCAKLCHTDDDCNTAGDMHCIQRKGVSYCYNDKNYEATGEPIKVTVF